MSTEYTTFSLPPHWKVNSKYDTLKIKLMILLVHMIFGVAIGSLFHNPAIAVVAAFFSHYFLDLFPHVEYLEGAEKLTQKIKREKWQNNFYDILKVIADFCAGLFLVFYFSANNLPIYFYYAIIAVIPDGLTVMNSLFPNKFLEIHYKIHGEKIQYLTKQKKFPLMWRILTQSIAIIVSIIFLKI